jgi:anti-sigma regulatory factor (Ser/Thr protein kinase)
VRYSVQTTPHRAGGKHRTRRAGQLSTEPGTWAGHPGTAMARSLRPGRNARLPMTGEQASAGLGAWQLWSSLELGPFPGAVPCARLHAKLILWEWGMQAIADAVELVVSELVTNALMASNDLAIARFPGCAIGGVSPVGLWLACDRRKVLIEVWDASTDLPVCQDLEPETESGRGLQLVEAMSADWGSYASADRSGKMVWAIVTAH